MAVRLPFYVRLDDVPLPQGWRAHPIENLYEKLEPGKLFDLKAVNENGLVPVLNQSADGFLGFHSDAPGVVASRNDPTVTFANHTCAMRVMERPYSSIQNVFSKRGKKGVCETLYLYYATHGRLPIEDYKGHHPAWRSSFVPVPPLATQQAIARTLRLFDDLIENNQRRIGLLEETARLSYREWFVNFRYPGHEDVPLVDSELGPIPQDWETRSFNEVADFINGFAFKSSKHWLEEGLPIIKIKELKAGLSDDTPRYHGNDIDTKYFIDNGDVLFSWSAHLDAYVWAGGPGLLNQHLFVVKPYELSKLFVFHSLRGQITEFRARAQGTTMKHIKRSALGEVLLRVPPPGIRQQFEQTVGPMMDLQLELQSSNRLLTETRDLLLPRLVSGDLDISDLDLSLEAVG